MKKILIVQSGNNISRNAFDFANWLNAIAPVSVTGFFLPEMVDARYEGIHAEILPENEDEIAEAECIKQFRELCLLHKIDHTIHKGSYEVLISQVRRESLYADLLVMSSDLYISNYQNGEQLHLADTLHKIQCPVIILPERYNFPDNLVLAYDGSESSAYAIKQFAYIFPELCQLPAMLVYADYKHDIPGKELIEEFGKCHYSRLVLARLEIDSDKYFTTWLANQKNSLLVTGAYGRSALSEMFKESFAQKLIKEQISPVFIAHV